MAQGRHGGDVDRHHHHHHAHAGTRYIVHTTATSTVHIIGTYLKCWRARVRHCPTLSTTAAVHSSDSHPFSRAATQLLCGAAGCPGVFGEAFGHCISRLHCVSPRGRLTRALAMAPPRCSLLDELASLAALLRFVSLVASPAMASAGTRGKKACVGREGCGCDALSRQPYLLRGALPLCRCQLTNSLPTPSPPPIFSLACNRTRPRTTATSRWL